MTPTTLGNVLYHLRDKAGLSQRSAGDKAGVSQNCISRRESGVTLTAALAVINYAETLGYEVVFRPKRPGIKRFPVISGGRG